LVNITTYLTVFRSMTLNQVGMFHLIKILTKNENKSVLQSGVWLLGNLCDSEPPPDYELIKEAIPFIAKVVIDETDLEILEAALHTLTILTDNDGIKEKVIQYLIHSGCLPKLVSFLKYNLHYQRFNLNFLNFRTSIFAGSLRILGNILAGHDDEQSHEVLKAGALDNFISLLGHTKMEVLTDIFSVLSDIACGKIEFISLIVYNTIYMEKIIFFMNSDYIDDIVLFLVTIFFYSFLYRSNRKFVR